MRLRRLGGACEKLCVLIMGGIWTLHYGVVGLEESSKQEMMKSD